MASSGNICYYCDRPARGRCELLLQRRSAKGPLPLMGERDDLQLGCNRYLCEYHMMTMRSVVGFDGPDVFFQGTLCHECLNYVGKEAENYDDDADEDDLFHGRLPFDHDSEGPAMGDEEEDGATDDGDGTKEMFKDGIKWLIKK